MTGGRWGGHDLFSLEQGMPDVEGASGGLGDHRLIHLMIGA